MTIRVTSWGWDAKHVNGEAVVQIRMVAARCKWNEGFHDSEWWKLVDQTGITFHICRIRKSCALWRCDWSMTKSALSLALIIGCCSFRFFLVITRYKFRSDIYPWHWVMTSRSLFNWNYIFSLLVNLWRTLCEALQKAPTFCTLSYWCIGKLHCLKSCRAKRFELPS